MSFPVLGKRRGIQDTAKRVAKARAAGLSRRQGAAVGVMLMGVAVGSLLAQVMAVGLAVEHPKVAVITAPDMGKAKASSPD